MKRRPGLLHSATVSHNTLVKWFSPSPAALVWLCKVPIHTVAVGSVTLQEGANPSTARGNEAEVRVTSTTSQPFSEKRVQLPQPPFKGGNLGQAVLVTF